MSVGRMIAVVATLLATGVAAQSAQGPVVNNTDTIPMQGTVLRGLDTLNGRTRDLTLRVGETAAFGYLEIRLDACLAPRDVPESDAYAYLSIRDEREAAPRFSGWMFASSPALSAMDHPRYDVWVLSCSNS